MVKIFLNFIYFTVFFIFVDGRGRMIDPAQRGSMWRYGFDTPHNYNDMSLNCGGIQQQWTINKGKWLIKVVFFLFKRVFNYILLKRCLW